MDKSVCVLVCACVCTVCAQRLTVSKRLLQHCASVCGSYLLFFVILLMTVKVFVVPPKEREREKVRKREVYLKYEKVGHDRHEMLLCLCECALLHDIWSLARHKLLHLNHSGNFVIDSFSVLSCSSWLKLPPPTEILTTSCWTQSLVLAV